MSATQNPILVEVHRGEVVESVHRGSAVVVDTGYREVFALGSPQVPMYPRSSLKFFQAIPLLESGAAAHFQLQRSEIAIACASHNAEEIHTRTLRTWLARRGLNDTHLESGPDWPLSKSAARELIRRGEGPSKIHQNCSGKHAAMLTLAQFLDAPTTGYSEYQHPVQQAWMRTFSELIEEDAFAFGWERDGCGMPALCMPLTSLARAFVNYAEPRRLSLGKSRAAALAQILDAVRENPYLLAGKKRVCTEIIKAAGGRIIAKLGAEGVYGGVIPERGLGFALKIDDGAGRAADVALGALLQKLDALNAAETAQLGAFFAPRIANSQGLETGKLLPAAAWD